MLPHQWSLLSYVFYSFLKENLYKYMAACLCADYCTEGTRAASTNNVLFDNAAKSLFAVAAVQALEQGVAWLHTVVGWWTESAKCAEMVELAGTGMTEFVSICRSNC